MVHGTIYPTGFGSKTLFITVATRKSRVLGHACYDNRTDANINYELLKEKFPNDMVRIITIDMKTGDSHTASLYDTPFKEAIDERSTV